MILVYNKFTFFGVVVETVFIILVNREEFARFEFESSNSVKDKLKSEVLVFNGNILKSFSINKLPTSEKIMSFIDSYRYLLLFSLHLNLKP